jgi:hypothetical protein
LTEKIRPPPYISGLVLNKIASLFEPEKTQLLIEFLIKSTILLSEKSGFFSERKNATGNGEIKSS